MYLKNYLIHVCSFEYLPVKILIIFKSKLWIRLCNTLSIVDSVAMVESVNRASGLASLITLIMLAKPWPTSPINFGHFSLIFVQLFRHFKIVINRKRWFRPLDIIEINDPINESPTSIQKKTPTRYKPYISRIAAGQRGWRLKMIKYVILTVYTVYRLTAWWDSSAAHVGLRVWIWVGQKRQTFRKIVDTVETDLKINYFNNCNYRIQGI